MKLYVPHLMDDLKLTADWSFRLYVEGRNDSLIAALGFSQPPYNHPDRATYLKRVDELFEGADSDGWLYRGTAHWQKPAVIPAGTVLRVKRIFVR